MTDHEDLGEAAAGGLGSPIDSLGVAVGPHMIRSDGITWSHSWNALLAMW